MYNIEKEKRDLCQEIGNFFGHYFEENGQLCIDNGEKVFRYNTPDELLADWVDTLIENHLDNLDSPSDSWEKEILFIFNFCIGKRPTGLRKLEQKKGTVWSVSVDVPNPKFPHGKSIYIGTYSSVVEAIRARRDYLNEDIANIDTNTDEGLAFAAEKAKARIMEAKINMQALRRTMNFAVVCSYSFDNDTAVYLFTNENEAKLFLKDNFEQEIKIDVEENGYDTESFISSDGWYAKIINHFADHDNVTEFRIGRVYQ